MLWPTDTNPEIRSALREINKKILLARIAIVAIALEFLCITCVLIYIGRRHGWWLALGAALLYGKFDQIILKLGNR